MTAQTRFEHHLQEWNVDVERTLETETSFLAFGCRRRQPVVLKVVKNFGDEWSAGEKLAAFEGRGTVRVFEYAAGAALLERALPGTPIRELVLEGRDEEATEILAGVIAQMSPSPSAAAIPVTEFAASFEKYLASGDRRIPNNLVSAAHETYGDLCRTQTSTRLLHGDLHHDNVIFDAARGWLAIDPKGVIGEVEFEIGATLRNPFDRPDLFTTPATIETRIRRFASGLKVDPHRVRAWAFAQAVLSAIWLVEDGQPVDPNVLTLAALLRAPRP